MISLTMIGVRLFKVQLSPKDFRLVKLVERASTNKIIFDETFKPKIGKELLFVVNGDSVLVRFTVVQLRQTSMLQTH
jgi:hypothetical protein